jgi:hypothetical protein
MFHFGQRDSTFSTQKFVNQQFTGQKWGIGGNFGNGDMVRSE